MNFVAGQKFRFKTDPKGEQGDVFTIGAVSQFVEMIKIKEFGLWCYTDNIVIVDESQTGTELA